MSVAEKGDSGPTGDVKNQWRLKEWFPELSPEVLGLMRIFFTELIHFNGRMNLISSRTESQADLIHFADCIIASKSILKETKRQHIYDIGSGNGFPGIILSILAPERKFTLVDKDARKVEFLKHIIARLSLKNVTAMHTRLEDLKDGMVECAVSRGFASIGKTLILARKVASSNCIYYHLKSDGWVKEVIDIPTQICSHWKPELVMEYSLPLNFATLNLVVTTKLKV